MTRNRTIRAIPRFPRARVAGHRANGQRVGDRPQRPPPVPAIITTTDPLISIGIAHFWLKETVASTTPALAAETVALALMVGGISALVHHAPHVARQLPGPSAEGFSRTDRGV